MKRICTLLVLLVGLAIVPALAAQNGWEIVKAEYGAGDQWVDVTERVRSLVQDDSLRLRVNGQTLGVNERRGQRRGLRLHLRAANGNTRTANYRDNQRVRLQVRNVLQSGLHINRAMYGNGNRLLDVTSRLNTQVRGEQLNVRVNNQTMGGDPAPGQEKSLTVDYSLDGRSAQRIVREGDTLHLMHGSTDQKGLQITRATYGTAYRSADVTTRLHTQIQGNQLHLQVNNDTMGGDPHPNQAKALTVQYAINGRASQVVVNEGNMLRLNSSTDQNVLQIHRGTYGSGYRSSDVTARLNSQIEGNQLHLRVNTDSMGGDPAPGQNKSLTVQYSLRGQTNQVVVNDGDMLRLNGGTLTSELAQRFRCESVQSNGYGRKYCPANNANAVRFVRQIGDEACTQNRTWGYDNNGVWVDQGCRAEFEIQGNGRVTGSTAPSMIQNGTELSIRTNELIDSNNTNPGQTFSALVAADVLDSAGTIIIPRGSDARLVVRSMSTGGVTSASELILDVDSLTVYGTRYTVSTTDLDQQGGQAVGANRKTAIMVGGGAALGTIIGAIVGGGKGAAIGAAIGAGGGLGAEVLTRGKQIRVPAETVLNFRLDQDLRLQASR